MQIAEALQVSHILHNRNVHLLHTAEASEESWIGVGIFPACTRTEDENASNLGGTAGCTVENPVLKRFLESFFVAARRNQH